MSDAIPVWTDAEHRAEIEDNTERCALLVEMRAGICRQSAKKIREAGTFYVRAIWPPFKKMKVVAHKWELRAQDMEAVAKAFDVVASCIRKGYDPRKLIDPEAKTDIGGDAPMWKRCKGCRCADCEDWHTCMDTSRTG